MVGERFVDVYTFSKEFQNVIIEEYPGVIFPSQVEMRNLNGKRTYCFRNLSLLELSLFLGETAELFPMEIRDSLTGNLVMRNYD